MSHMMGPKLNAKQAMYASMLPIAVHFNMAEWDGCENAKLRMSKLIAMPAKPINNRGRRPNVSIKGKAMMVNNTNTTPIPMVAKIAVVALSKPANLKIVGA